MFALKIQQYLNSNLREYWEFQKSIKILSEHITGRLKEFSGNYSFLFCLGFVTGLEYTCKFLKEWMLLQDDLRKRNQKNFFQPS